MDIDNKMQCRKQATVRWALGDDIIFPSHVRRCSACQKRSKKELCYECLKKYRRYELFEKTLAYGKAGINQDTRP